MRRRNIPHAAAETQPARQCKDERFRGVERTKIHFHGIWFGQSAKLRHSKFHRRYKLTIRLAQFSRDIQTIAPHGALDRLR